eukprot:2875868-Pyramimonas_sp.AAC.1
MLRLVGLVACSRWQVRVQDPSQKRGWMKVGLFDDETTAARAYDRVVAGRDMPAAERNFPDHAAPVLPRPQRPILPASPAFSPFSPFAAA